MLMTASLQGECRAPVFEEATETNEDLQPGDSSERGTIFPDVKRQELHLSYNIC